MWRDLHRFNDFFILQFFGLFIESSFDFFVFFVLLFQVFNSTSVTAGFERHVFAVIVICEQS